MINWTHICQKTTHFYRHYDKQSRLSVFTWILMHFVLVRNITVFTLWETEQIVGFHLNLDVLVRNITFFTIWETEQIVCFHLNLNVLVRNITFFTLWDEKQMVCFLLTLDVLVTNITVFTLSHNTIWHDRLQYKLFPVLFECYQRNNWFWYF